jgi:hypothetical protein
MNPITQFRIATGRNGKPEFMVTRESAVVRIPRMKGMTATDNIEEITHRIPPASTKMLPAPV